MKRKLTLRNKKHYSKLITWAKKEDLGLQNLLQVLSGVREIKQAERIANRYGTREDWDAAELSSSMISVPIVSFKDGQILSYAAYFSKDMLPDDKKVLYEVHFKSESSAEGMLSDVEIDESVTDAESRDGTIK
ncbi:hypothetical protein EYS14_16405 [Alteromonadaceae bacterium M269]|nr:hypothetical protein EYS14_16405 [Alteromonadaceae bacterium M269]